MLISRVFLLFAVCFSVAFAATSERAQIAISDLKPSYCAGELLKVTIWNRGDRPLSINVAIETLVEGKWVEAWASLKTPPEQNRTQIAEPDRVEPGQSVAYSFDIFRFPVRADLAKSKWRLRADATVATRQTSFASSEFALCSD